MNWMLMPLKRYADFSGRSRRTEYWMWTAMIVAVTILSIIVGFVFSDVSEGLGSSNILGMIILFPFGLFSIAIIVPSIAVQVRRLHDRDVSGLWLLLFYPLAIVPIIGFVSSVALLIFMCLPGTVGDNRFGPDPKNPYGGTDVFN